MSNTKDLFDAIDAYMVARSEAREEYQLMGRRYAKAKGSPYYDEQMEAARKKRAATMEAAQATARANVRKILTEMQEQAGKITMQPPTQEMLSILQLLKYKENVTQAELDSAANAMQGNGTALGILDEMAEAHNRKDREHPIRPVYHQMATAGLNSQQAYEAIRRVAVNCENIIKNTHGGNSIATSYKEYHARLFGGTVDYDEIQEEPRYEDVIAFTEAVSPVSYDIFSKAVDAPVSE
ncbi:MAG: hypothetical protein IKO22_04215 [Oscillospiraceae bacterium]|nr:hypothetical protein [Oscillospiraceae bacterium]